MTSKSNVQVVTALVVSVCLVSSIFARSRVVVAGVTPNAEDVAEAEGARQFDEAVLEIGRILTLDLTTEKGARESSRIFEKNYKKLALAEKKALNAGRKVTAFSEGIKAEAAKRKGGKEELARELKANPSKILEVPGAQEAGRAIQESLKPAGEVLRKVADALDKAADAAKRKEQSQTTNSVGGLLIKAGYRQRMIVTEPLFRSVKLEGMSSEEAFAVPYSADGCLDNPVCAYLFLITFGLGHAIFTFKRCSRVIDSAFTTYLSCKRIYWWDELRCTANFARTVGRDCPWL